MAAKIPSGAAITSETTVRMNVLIREGNKGRILGIFFIFYDFPESAVSGALFFDQLFRLYLLADFINLVPGGGNGTVHICDMLLKILVV